jgi:hypothetical protein
MREISKELFGPTAVVYRVKDKAEAVELANSSSYGLGGSVWTTDEELAARVADELEVGMVWINRIEGGARHRRVREQEAHSHQARLALRGGTGRTTSASATTALPRHTTTDSSVSTRKSSSMRLPSSPSVTRTTTARALTVWPRRLGARNWQLACTIRP